MKSRRRSDGLARGRATAPRNTVGAAADGHGGHEMSDSRNPQTERPPITTTDAGIPVASDEHSLTVGPSGPILLQITT